MSACPIAGYSVKVVSPGLSLVKAHTPLCTLQVIWAQSQSADILFLNNLLPNGPRSH